jgi:hypothetical protein
VRASAHGCRLEDSHMNYIGGPLRLLRERYGCGPDDLEFHDAVRVACDPIDDPQLLSQTTVTSFFFFVDSDDVAGASTYVSTCRFVDLSVL